MPAGPGGDPARADRVACFAQLEVVLGELLEPSLRLADAERRQGRAGRSRPRCRRPSTPPRSTQAARTRSIGDGSVASGGLRAGHVRARPAASHVARSGTGGGRRGMGGRARRVRRSASNGARAGSRARLRSAARSSRSVDLGFVAASAGRGRAASWSGPRGLRAVAEPLTMRSSRGVVRDHDHAATGSEDLDRPRQGRGELLQPPG